MENCFLFYKKLKHVIPENAVFLLRKDKYHGCITFDFVKCSASHFPKENVQHQQNVMLNIFQRKMYAEHFPKENVQQSKMLQMYLMLLCFLHSKKQRQCKNVFDAAVFFAQQKTKAVQKCI